MEFSSGFHPVYEYLAKAYRLDLRAMHWEPEELPPPDQWEALDALLKQHPSHVMPGRIPRYSPSLNSLRNAEFKSLFSDLRSPTQQGFLGSDAG